MKITPKVLEGIYAGLRLLAPFKPYRLPQPHLVKFKLSRSQMMMGEYDRECDGHTITVSTAQSDTLPKVVETLLHEMVHMALEKKGCGDHAYHDSAFNALAAAICNEYGYDFRTF